MGIVRRLRRHSWVASYLSLFIALGLGSAYAATELDKNEVKSKHIKNAGVKNADLANDAVTSSKVADGSLLGEDFAAGQFPQGPQGERGPQGVQGETGPRGPSGATNVISRIASIPAGHNTSTVECNPGEQAIAGGAWANDRDDFMNRSYPQGTWPGVPTGWTATIFDAPGNADGSLGGGFVFVVCASP
jgi:hypothetical protein